MQKVMAQGHSVVTAGAADCSLASRQLTLQNFHREDGPGIFQVGNVDIAGCITGQANVQNPGEEKKVRES